MKTCEAQKIVLEVLAGQRGPTGDPTGWTRPSRWKEWNLAKAARCCFADGNGKRLLPHVERALFARALQRLRRDGLVQMRLGLPNVIWIKITGSGIKALEFGLGDTGDPEAQGTRPCPRCGYYSPAANPLCAICREDLAKPPEQVAGTVGRLKDPDAFMSSEMAWAGLRRWGIYALSMVLCVAALFLMALILEGTELTANERALVPAATMGLVLGAGAGLCLVMCRAGFYAGLIFFTVAYLTESAVRVAVGGTRYELWGDAIYYYLVSGLPIAVGFAIVIGVALGRVVRGHGGRI